MKCATFWAYHQEAVRGVRDGVLISEGPEIPVVSKHFPGKFRISYRAGNELRIGVYD